MNKKLSQRILNPCLSLLVVSVVHCKAIGANSALQIHQDSISTETGFASVSSQAQFYKRTKLGISGEIKLSLQRLLEYNSRVQSGACAENPELKNFEQSLDRKISALSSTIDSNILILRDLGTYYRRQNIIAGLNDASLITSASAVVIAAFAAIGAAGSLSALCSVPFIGTTCLFTVGLSAVNQTVAVGTGLTKMPMAEMPPTSDVSNNRIVLSAQDIESRLEVIRKFEVEFQGQTEKIYSDRINDYEKSIGGIDLSDYLERAYRKGPLSAKFVSAAFSRAITNEMLRIYLVAEFIDLRHQTAKLCGRKRVP